MHHHFKNFQWFPPFRIKFIFWSMTQKALRGLGLSPFLCSQLLSFLYTLPQNYLQFLEGTIFLLNLPLVHIYILTCNKHQLLFSRSNILFLRNPILMYFPLVLATHIHNHENSYLPKNHIFIFSFWDGCISSRP